MKQLKFSWSLSAILILSLIFTGCLPFGLVTGTGNIITRQYEFNNFSDIEVSNAFEIEITPSSSYSVSITTYENIFDYLDISQSGDTLIIGMKPGTFTTANPKATITLPELHRLVLSGASHGSATGFQSSNDYELELSGASSLELGISTGNSRIEVSGASRINGQLNSQDTDMEISGASRVDLSGAANNLILEVSGASQANLPNFPVQSATTEISGASNATLTVNETLDVDVSGASTLNYSGNPVLGNISVTGASSLNHR